MYWYASTGTHCAMLEGASGKRWARSSVDGVFLCVTSSVAGCVTVFFALRVERAA